MTKTEYTAAIKANQTAISEIRAEIRKLRNIEKLAKSFTEPQKLVDFDLLTATIAEKKTKLQSLRSELGKARRIVKRMTEIEDIEAGKTKAPKSKKAANKKKDASKKDAGTADKTAEKAAKKFGTKSTPVKKPSARTEAGKPEQPAPAGDVKESLAA